MQSFNIEKAFGKRLQGEFVQGCMSLKEAFSNRPAWSIANMAEGIQARAPADRFLHAQEMQGRVREALQFCGHLIEETLESESGLGHRIWRAVAESGLFTRADINEVVTEQVSGIPLEILLSNVDPATSCERALDRVKRRLVSLCGASSGVSCLTSIRYQDKREPSDYPDECEHPPKIEFMPETECKAPGGVLFHVRLTEGQHTYDEYGLMDVWPAMFLEVRSPCSPRRQNELTKDAWRLMRVLHWVLAVLPWWQRRALIGTRERSHVVLGAKTTSPPNVWRISFQRYFGDPKSDVTQAIRNAVAYAGMFGTATVPASELILAVSAIESLLVPTGDKAETLARRSAYLLTPAKEKRADWYRLFKGTYDRRSRFVHGGLPEVTAAELSSAQLWFAELMRSLLHFLQYRHANGVVENKKEELKETMAFIDADSMDSKRDESGYIPPADLMNELSGAGASSFMTLPRTA